MSYSVTVYMPLLYLLPTMRHPLLQWYEVWLDSNHP